MKNNTDTQKKDNPEKPATQGTQDNEQHGHSKKDNSDKLATQPVLFVILCTLCCWFLWIVLFLSVRVVLHLVYTVLIVSLDCPFLSARVVLHLVYPVLLVSLDCPF
jgi:hypothetical protein